MEILATGAKLTPKTFADFITRLKHDVAGKGVERHCTRDAIFNVERLRRVTGTDLSFDPLRMLTTQTMKLSGFPRKNIGTRWIWMKKSI